jgi:hypothetical protein
MPARVTDARSSATATGCHRILLFVSITCTLAAAAPSTTTQQSDPFLIALKSAASYPIQYRDPASVQEGIARYTAVLDRFPLDPRRYQAKWAIVTILRVESSRASLKQAAPIVSELAKQADQELPEGQEILMGAAEFHVGAACGQPCQDLALAQDCLNRVARQVPANEPSLLGLRLVTCSTKLQALQGQPLQALDRALSTIQTSMEWSKKGFWKRLYDNDRKQYEQYIDQLGQLGSTAAWCALQTDDLRAIELLRERPRLLDQVPPLGDALKQAETKNRR